MLNSLLTLVAAAAVATSAPSLKWEKDYGKALKQVRSDDRPLLVVLDKPGQEVDAKLLGDKGNKTLAKYDLCRVDVSTKYGKQVAAAFNAKSFPHVAFVDKTGSVILHTQKGKINKDSWKAALAKYQAGSMPQRHVVLRPTSTSNVSGEYYQPQPTQQYYPGNTYPGNSYCPSCNKGY